MTIHSRLVALARDPEIPRWCRWAIGVGFFIVGPIDELVIYPVVMGYVYFRRRHVLERHGFGGAHALGAVVASLVVMVALGVATDRLVEVARGASGDQGYIANHAYTSEDGRTYTKRVTTSTATLALTRARFKAKAYRGFLTAASVWIGASDKRGRWIQVGVTIDSSQAVPCVYLETNVPRYSLSCVRAARFGEKVAVRMSFSYRWGWVAWVDGHAVGSAKLGPLEIAGYATSETYGPATKIGFSIIT